MVSTTTRKLLNKEISLLGIMDKISYSLFLSITVGGPPLLVGYKKGMWLIFRLF